VIRSAKLTMHLRYSGTPENGGMAEALLLLPFQKGATGRRCLFPTVQ